MTVSAEAASGSTSSGGVNYSVTPEYLAQAYTDTLNTAEQVQEQLSQLKTYVQSVEDVWQGIASNTFQTLMQDYTIYSSMLHDALVNIAGGLHGTYANYVNSEGQNINNLSALGEDLPMPSTGTNFD